MRDQAGSSGITTRSQHRDHIMVNLFDGWTTDPQPSSSTSSTTHNELDSVQVKRSDSQQGSLWPDIDAAPTFDSISFPKKDSSFAVSLYTGLKDADPNDAKELPPSKRPGVSHARKTPPNHIKRPRNAYIIFRSHTVSQKLIPKEVENDHRNISRIIAHMWKSLAPEDRAHYEQIAKEEKERHKQLFPDYRYHPTTRRTEVSKRNVKKLENGEEECQEIADIILKAQGKDGVVVRSGPSKAVKRAREATRRESNAPRTKRAKVTKPKSAKASPAESAGEEVLQTVFLQPSPSHSPTATIGSASAMGSAHALSPEPFRLASTSPAAGEAQHVAPHEADPVAVVDIFGRRASSLPALRPCSPPPSFVMAAEQASAADAVASDLRTDVPQDSTSCAVDTLVMPAPAWKGRQSQPPPIPNTWQYGSYDDQALPSPRSFNNSFAATASRDGTATGRPRTAMPSTPSSGTFRGFFHPWAFDHGDSMLISPVTASFQDARRRSSFARNGSIAGRRPGSFGVEAHQSVGRVEGVEGGLPACPSDAQLFDEAARAAAISLDSEAVADEYDDSQNFAFDPALEGEGGTEPTTSSLGVRGPANLHYAGAVASPMRKPESPRTSFSGSTLAAAARDWASIKRRRSRMSQSTVVEPYHETQPPYTGNISTGTCGDATEADKTRSSLEESIERAVMLALGKDGGRGGERNSQIVQQILSSLSSELALHQGQTDSQTLYAGQQGSHRFSNAPSPRPTTRERRSGSLRGSQYYAGTTGGAAEYRAGKPLPSPLQLVMSNHEMGNDSFSHLYK